MSLNLIESRLQVVRELTGNNQIEKVLEITDAYPLYTNFILKHLQHNNLVPASTIEAVSNLKKLPIKKILSKRSESSLVITPLYHSASITIHPESPFIKYYLKYKKKGSQHWFPSIPLEYDPSSNTFTSSIVNLFENTIYIVQISPSLDFSSSESLELITKTTPKFSDDNIYLLSDIYQGGTLDLIELGISGSENNWVKIVGDNNTVISTNETVDSAINIGANSYIYFDNINIAGGGRHAISAKNAHHLWFNGCEISRWGREARYTIENKSYASENDTNPINYDSAFSLIKTGVVTIENCHVHSPRVKANSWKNGHPYGANAVLVNANHPIKAYQGQIVIRNNRFYGTDQHRFNDVIESRNNGSPFGGFVRDSAIYNNYLAYANDDIIEIDGSQSNVLVYNNEIEQGFCGISAIPNRQGPSYIFNNYIHNLGDQNGRSWSAIKLGGLVSRPAGKVNIFNNLIKTSSNGISSAVFKNDSTFWADVWSNIIIINKYKKNKLGYSVFENTPFALNRYNNNYVFNYNMENNNVMVKYNYIFNINNYHHLPFGMSALSKNYVIPATFISKRSITNNSTLDGTMTVGPSLINLKE